MLRQLHHFTTLSSTHLFAKENLLTFSKDTLHILLADYQTHGIGTKGAAWQSSAAKNLLVTYVLFTKSQTGEELLLSLALCCQTLLLQKGFTPTIKWPNDLFINGKKVAGVLGETLPQEKGLFALLSLGLNVNEEAFFLKNIGQPATSLFLESGSLFDRMALLGELTYLFEQKINCDVYTHRSSFLGKWAASKSRG